MSTSKGNEVASKVEVKKQDRKIFKTWGELFNHLGIVPIRISFMDGAEEVLRRLRACAHKTCSDSYQVLLDSFLDEVVEAYSERSVFSQLCALGTAMQELGLRLCGMKDSNGYRIWMMRFSDTQEYMDFWKSYLTRRQFFGNIHTFSMRDGERLDAPHPDIDLKLFQEVRQARMPISKDPSPGVVFILSGTDTVGTGTVRHFLCVPAFKDLLADSTKVLYVYDADTFRPLESSVTFDRNNLEPYTLRIWDGGLSYLFVGDSLTKVNGWKPVRYRNGTALPVYERDTDFIPNEFPYWNTLDDSYTVLDSGGRYTYAMNHSGVIQRYDCTTGDVWIKSCNFLPDVQYIRPFRVEGVLWFFCVCPGSWSEGNGMFLWCPGTGEALSGSGIHRKPNVLMDSVAFYEDAAYLSFTDGRVCRTKPFEQILDYLYDTLEGREKSFPHVDWVLFKRGNGMSTVYTKATYR